jgi:hypothetical protein
MENYSYSKQDYLSQKIQIEPCNNCIENRLKYNLPLLQCGICFWNACQLPIDKVPECSRCIIDTKNYGELFHQKKEKDWKPLCCKQCLWWDWNETKRRNMKK